MQLFFSGSHCGTLTQTIVCSRRNCTQFFFLVHTAHCLWASHHRVFQKKKLCSSFFSGSHGARMQTLTHEQTTVHVSDETVATSLSFFLSGSHGCTCTHTHTLTTRSLDPLLVLLLPVLLQHFGVENHPALNEQPSQWQKRREGEARRDF